MPRPLAYIAFALITLLTTLPVLIGGHDCGRAHAHDHHDDHVHEHDENEPHTIEADRGERLTTCALDESMLICAQDRKRSPRLQARPVLASVTPEPATSTRVIVTYKRFRIAPKTSPPSLSTELMFG